MSANLCVQAHMHELLEQGFEVAVRPQFFEVAHPIAGLLRDSLDSIAGLIGILLLSLHIFYRKMVR